MEENRKDKKIKIRLLPSQKERVESGPIKFGEDFAGTFIRGDDAFYYNTALIEVLRVLKAQKSHPIMVLGPIQSLFNLLNDSNEHEMLRDGMAEITEEILNPKNENEKEK